MTIAKKGTLLSITCGCWSDKVNIGFFVVLNDFSPTSELKLYLEKFPEEKEDYAFCGDTYLAALLSKGYLLEIKYGELHLTDYGSIDEFRFTPLLEETDK